jgi:hypothetical protein
MKDPAKVVLVRKNLRLERQEDAARIHQIDAGQVVFQGDFLRPEVFSDRFRKIAPALDGRIVGDDHAFATVDQPDPREDSCGGDFAVMSAPCGQRRKLEERALRIDKLFHPFPHEEFSTLALGRDSRLRASFANLLQTLAEILDQPTVVAVVLDEFRG